MFASIAIAAGILASSTGCAASQTRTSEPAPTVTVTVTPSTVDTPTPAGGGNPTLGPQPKPPSTLIQEDTSPRAPSWATCQPGFAVGWALRTATATIVGCGKTNGISFVTTAVINGATYTSTDAYYLDGCFNAQATDQETTICYGFLDDILAVQNGEVSFKETATQGWMNDKMVGN